MSVPVDCPECGAFVGDFGMNHTGTTTCGECGETIDLSNHTAVGGEPFRPDGIENPSEGDRVRSINGTGRIDDVFGDEVLIDLDRGTKDFKSVDDIEYVDE